MATTEAIAAVTMAIRRLLLPALTLPDGTAVPVEPMTAAGFLEPRETSLVSIHLYRVAANTNRRNLPPRFTPEGRRFRPALPLDLYYLLSVWGKDAQWQQQLLGRVLRALDDTPILSASFLNDGGAVSYAGTFRNDEAVELVYDPLSLTDMVSLWDLLKPGIQPSCTYVARAVAIESEIELFLGDPVAQRQFDYLAPLPDGAAP